MNQVAYNDLITKTFLDNAIRSVLMIDDDYLTYENVLQSQENGRLDSIFENEQKKTTSVKASKLQKFFNGRNFICDISDGVNSFKADRARKSDLLILDYQLSNNDPKESLEILHSMANSNHMNLVVIYTHEDLKEAWLQTAVSLRSGFKNEYESIINSSEEFEEFWNDKTDDDTIVPEEWKDFTQDELAEYLLSNNIKKFHARIASFLEACEKKYTVNTTKASLLRLLDDYDILKCAQTNYENFKGEFSNTPWLLIGNVFIAFHKKKNDEMPDELWKTLEDSLIKWNPNYFRLILSEMQNVLENEGVSFAQFNSSQYFEQAGWLWQILSDSASLTMRDLLKQNMTKLSDSLLLNTDLLAFSENLKATISSEFPQKKLIEGRPTDAEKQEAFETVKVQLEIALNKTKQSVDIDHAAIVHELNKSLSLKEISSNHITTGMVLKGDGDSWFICVSPACDCVPEQNNTQLTKRLAPDYKPLKLLELKPINLELAVEKSTNGKCLFLDDKVALEVFGEPKIDYVFVHNLDNNVDGTFNVSFMIKAGGALQACPRQLYAMAQLKEEYAARFQAMASHHTGRIGVDFVPFGLEK